MKFKLIGQLVKKERKKVKKKNRRASTLKIGKRQSTSPVSKFGKKAELDPVKGGCSLPSLQTSQESLKWIFTRQR